MSIIISKSKIRCSACGKQYYLIEECYPMRDKDELQCEQCGYILKKWNAAVTYYLEDFPNDNETGMTT